MNSWKFMKSLETFLIVAIAFSQIDPFIVDPLKAVLYFFF